MDFLSNYMRLSREERTKHIDLSTPCEFSRPTPSGRASISRGKLLLYHELVDDVLFWKENKLNVCHLCECSSNKGWCDNPLHAYIGTHSENQQDKSYESRRRGGWKAKGRSDLIKYQRFAVCIYDGHLSNSGSLQGRIKKILGVPKKEKLKDPQSHYVIIEPSEVELYRSMTNLQRLLALGMK